MRISAKVDYAVRAAVELAVSSPDRDAPPTKGDVLGEAQSIPTRYLESILSEMRRAGIVGSRRGSDGGYWLARPAESVSVADIIRAVEGPLADVRGSAPEHLAYEGAATHLELVWLATRASLRRVLENATLDAIVKGELGDTIVDLLSDPDAGERR